MRNPIVVAIETLSIGIVAIIYNIAIYRIINGEFPDNYRSMIIGAFLLGAFIHLSFEYSGANEWWCKKTYKL
jgi:hypothetical protein